MTKTVCDNPHLERILRLSPVALLKIEGKCAGCIPGLVTANQPLSSFTNGSATKYGIIVFRGSGFRYTETVDDRNLETDAVINCTGAHGCEGMQ